MENLQNRIMCLEDERKRLCNERECLFAELKKLNASLEKSNGKKRKTFKEELHHKKTLFDIVGKKIWYIQEEIKQAKEELLNYVSKAEPVKIEDKQKRLAELQKELNRLSLRREDYETTLEELQHRLGVYSKNKKLKRKVIEVKEYIRDYENCLKKVTEQIKSIREEINRLGQQDLLGFISKPDYINRPKWEDSQFKEILEVFKEALDKRTNDDEEAKFRTQLLTALREIRDAIDNLKEGKRA